jgi:aminoglycoside/choline kinase family phosphotransferase
MRDPRTEARVREAVTRATGRDARAAPVARLAGHASLRSYWRVGAPPDSLVVMVLPPDAKPEEVTKGGAPAVNPFVDVQRYLEGLGVRVPRIHAFYEPEGLMVLEDLGDVTLEEALRALLPPEARADRSGGLGGPGRPPAPAGWGPLYEVAIDQLARLRAAAEARPGGCVAFGRAFERDLYRWELDHFREWLLEAWKGARLSPEEAAVVDRAFDAIAGALDAEPKGFTHRDYQSRNLMVLPDGAQAVIDFQDALLGPRQYDLVALLRDSYVELEAAFVERMLRRYLDRLEAEGGRRLPYGPFRATFDLLTVQRKLKDAGRFVYIDRVKGNPGFLVSIPASLRYVREALLGRPELAELQAELARHVPELAA